MVMDYQGNSRKSKEEKEPPPKKEIEKVVVGEVVIKKKGIGAKFREAFTEADFGSVTNYVIFEVLIPAAKNTIVDIASKGAERMMFGDRAVRYRNSGASRVTTYSSNPINYRNYADYRDRDVPVSRGRLPSDRDVRPQRHSGEELIFATKEDAAVTLERMGDVIDTYEAVSVADLKMMSGVGTTPIDNKWGWIYLGDAQVQQIREGFLLILPPAEPIT